MTSNSLLLTNFEPTAAVFVMVFLRFVSDGPPKKNYDVEWMKVLLNSHFIITNASTVPTINGNVLLSSMTFIFSVKY